MPFNSKRHPSALISWPIIIILPLYSLPWVIYRMYRLEKMAFVQYAFFMGLAGMLYPPSGDLYSYYKDYTLFSGLKWDDFLFLALIKFDYILSFLLYALSENGLSCDLSRFVFNFVGYLLTGLLFVDIVKANRHLWNKRNILQALVIFVSVSLYAFLFRASLGLIFFVYGAYYIIYEDKKSCWFYIVLSVLTHFSYIVFAILLFVSKRWPMIIKKNKYYKVLIFLMVFGMLYNGILFDVTGFSGAIFERYKGYVENSDAGLINKSFSWKMLLWMRIIYIVILILLFFYVRFRDFGKRKEKSFVNYLIVICAVASPFTIIFTRFIAPLTYFLKFFLLHHFQPSKLMCKYMSILFWVIIIVNCLNLWAKRRELIISDMPMMFTSTSFSIMNHQYSAAWIDRNIGEGGEILEFEE